MSHEDFEEKTWRQRMHVDPEGVVYIPGIVFKNAMSDAAQFKPLQIPGKGKTTYTKHIKAGVMCIENPSLGIVAADVYGKWLHVPPDGKAGGNKRVLKCFPLMTTWGCTVSFLLVDDIVPEDIFDQVLRDAGALIGIGRWRPKNNGTNGRFEVVSVKWS